MGVSWSLAVHFDRDHRDGPSEIAQRELQVENYRALSARYDNVVAPAIETANAGESVNARDLVLFLWVEFEEDGLDAIETQLSQMVTDHYLDGLDELRSLMNEWDRSMIETLRTDEVRFDGTQVVVPPGALDAARESGMLERLLAAEDSALPGMRESLDDARGRYDRSKWARTVALVVCCVATFVLFLTLIVQHNRRRRRREAEAADSTAEPTAIAVE